MGDLRLDDRIRRRRRVGGVREGRRRGRSANRIRRLRRIDGRCGRADRIRRLRLVSRIAFGVRTLDAVLLGHDDDAGGGHVLVVLDGEVGGSGGRGSGAHGDGGARSQNHAVVRMPDQQLFAVTVLDRDAVEQNHCNRETKLSNVTGE